MRRVRWLLALALLLVPGLAQALQLHWSSGADTLTFTEATRAILVLWADSAEVTLPPEWRLLWVGDSTEVEVVALDSLEVCEGDTAQVYGVDGPSTPEDSTAHRVTAHFCSGGSSAAEQAVFQLDLPAWGRGKCKVVALDPADSTAVLESNEVTFNGGVSDPYPPVVLRASSVHQSLQLEVTAVGVGLQAATSLSIEATDGAWNLPLEIITRGNSEIHGVASVAALLPACLATVGSATGITSAASLAADPEIQPDIPESGGCSAQYFEELVQPPPPNLGYAIQPKDFAFTPGFVDSATNRYALHLFYIRHSYYTMPADSNERNLGHAWSSDFVSWHGPAAGDKPDTTVLSCKLRTGKFDARHVWAPTVVHPPGPTFYMFYTGVGTDGGKEHQRIGVATSTDLNAWTPNNNPVLTAPEIPWAKKNPLTYNSSQQLRDPFVMEYPVGSGNWIMYFVTVDSLTRAAEDMAVGAAISTDLIHWSSLAAPFAATERSTFQGHTHFVESPHVFKHNGQWWMPYTVGLNQVFFETSPTSDPTDTDPSHWTNPVWLRGVSQGRPAELQYWHASEHLQFGTSTYEWLAAFDDNASSIDIKGMFPTDSAGVDSLLLDCPPKPPVAGAGAPHGPPGQLRLVVMHPHLGSPDVGLRLELPWRTSARLAVYDVAGRRLITLVDRELPAGVTDVKWNGAADGGSRVVSGTYFIRLSCAQGAQVSKVIMLR